MTAAEFRRFALSLPDAIEASHMGHPDFRVGGKIFATLGYPHRAIGVVILTPDSRSCSCAASRKPSPRCRVAGARRAAPTSSYAPPRRPLWHRSRFYL